MVEKGVSLGNFPDELLNRIQSAENVLVLTGAGIQPKAASQHSGKLKLVYGHNTDPMNWQHPKPSKKILPEFGSGTLGAES